MDNSLVRYAKAFKALSNPNRLSIYREVLHKKYAEIEGGDGSCSFTECIAALKVGAPTVSHHIKELVNAELITVEKNGKFVKCFLNEKMKEDLEVFFGNDFSNR